MKAILVIDMPNGCSYCDFCHTRNYDSRYNIDGDKYCCIEELNVNDYYYNEKPRTKPNWCPLILLPKKKTVVSTDTTSAVAIKFGWNNCLSEILEGNHETSI